MLQIFYFNGSCFQRFYFAASTKTWKYSPRFRSSPRWSVHHSRRMYELLWILWGLVWTVQRRRVRWRRGVQRPHRRTRKWPCWTGLAPRWAFPGHQSYFASCSNDVFGPLRMPIITCKASRRAAGEPWRRWVNLRDCEQSIDWLIDWVLVRLIDCSTDWLFNWLMTNCQLHCRSFGSIWLIDEIYWIFLDGSIDWLVSTCLRMHFLLPFFVVWRWHLGRCDHRVPVRDRHVQQRSNARNQGSSGASLRSGSAAFGREEASARTERNRWRKRPLTLIRSPGPPVSLSTDISRSSICPFRPSTCLYWISFSFPFPLQVLYKMQQQASSSREPQLFKDLANSFAQHLSQMLKCHRKLCDIKRRCLAAKQELCTHLHARLK